MLNWKIEETNQPGVNGFDNVVPKEAAIISLAVLIYN